MVQPPVNARVPVGKSAGFWLRWRPLLQKELRETLRDTRTIGTLLLMPILVYPLLSLLMQNFIPRSITSSESLGFVIAFDSKETYDILHSVIDPADESLRHDAAVVKMLIDKGAFQWAGSGAKTMSPPEQGQSDEANAQSLAAKPTEPPGQTILLSSEIPAEPESLELTEHQWVEADNTPDAYDKMIRDGFYDLVIRRWEANNASFSGTSIELIYDPSRDFSRRAANFVARRIERYNFMRSGAALQLANAPPTQYLTSFESPIEPKLAPVVSFATIIPLILIMMTITGAVYPAIDLTAGERERGTLESLMAAPVSRVAILAAKYVAVWMVAMLTASVNVASMLVTLWVLQLDVTFLGSQGLSFWVVLQIFLLLGLFALFFSAVLLVVTSAARSFKEAQAYLIPLMMFSLTQGALALMPDFKSELWLALVPMVNLVLLSRDVMMNTVSVDFAWLATISTLLYSAAALSLAASVFGSDAVLYGSEGSWRELLWPSQRRPIPTPSFSLLLLASLFPLQFLMIGVLGRLQAENSALFVILAMTIFTAFLFAIVPIGVAALRGFHLRKTFALHRPGAWDLVAGLLLGASLWPFVGASLWGLGQLRAWTMGAESAAWSEQVVQLAYQQLSGWSEIPIWLLIVCLAVIPAVCEELFFRGLLLQSLRQKNRDWVAIVASGLAFGLFHFIVESSVAPLRFLVSASLGMVLAWVCIRTGSVIPSMLLHSVNNGMLTGLALYREQLKDAPPSGNLVLIVMVTCVVGVLVGVALLRRRRPHRLLNAVVVSGLLLGLTSPLLLGEEDERSPALPQVADGWSIGRFADDRLAHDIHCLAIGPENEIFVAGPGYVVQLLDANGDGVADQALPLALQPKQGAQGLWVEKDHVWVVADQAIWQVERGGSQAVRRFLALPKTGGEHDFHAIRRGHDGYLYFLAGNHAQIDREFATDSLPVPQPREGVLGRISPDGSHRQIIVHGMRNAYGFDFALDSSFLIYDSDDERDTGLPWYRPTTLFAAQEGEDIGWVSRCFKKPLGALGAARVISETGRGSPTGVACQVSPNWGAEYFGGVVFADWTFGRVYLLPSQWSEGLKVEPMRLVESHADCPFAPTSMAFSQSGDLYVATGGRNTTGVVYRISRDLPPDSPAKASGGQALKNLADWFARNGLSSPGILANDPQDSWKAIIAAATELDDHLSELQEQGVPDFRCAAWRRDGRRSLIRRHLLNTASGFAADTRDEWIRRLAEWDARFGADAFIWMAMQAKAPPGGDITSKWDGRLNQGADLPGLDSRSLVSLSLLDANLLQGYLNRAAGTKDSPAPPSAWVLAALAHRGVPLEIQEREWQTALDAFAFDLESIANGKGAALQWSDWLLVWRYLLDSPTPHDGNTGPWDFMLRKRLPPWERLQSERLKQTWENAWQTASTPATSGELKSERELLFRSESQRHLLEIQLLLDFDSSTLARRWQLWFQDTLDQEEIADSDASPPRSVLEPGWNPVSRLQAMTLLAAIEKPWLPGTNPIVADFLLNVDRQMELHHVSMDNNWQTRFEELGRLLVLGDPELPVALARSAAWKRATQVPVLRFLPPRQQIQAVKALEKSWDQWEVWALDDFSLAILENSAQAWELTSLDPETTAAVRSRIRETRALQKRLIDAAYPPLAAESLAETLAELETQVPWNSGDIERGRRLFAARNCLTCHGQNGRLGPALSGVTQRFQRREIIELLLNPDLRITDRYRPVLVQLVDGRMVLGRPVYQSTDGVLLEDQTGKMWQWRRDEIEQIAPVARSLMPRGLMQNSSLQDWADLWAFLKR